MKVTEITEGWGDALKNVASGFLQGATGIKPMCDSAQKNYENPANFLQDLNKIGALIYSFIKK